MKFVKVNLLLLVLIVATIATLWVLKLINQAQAVDYGGKLLGVVLILMVTSYIVSKVLGKSVSNSDKTGPENQGPRFN